jgi:hypothetical protein
LGAFKCHIGSLQFLENFFHATSCFIDGDGGCALLLSKNDKEDLCMYALTFCGGGEVTTGDSEQVHQQQIPSDLHLLRSGLLITKAARRLLTLYA